MRILTITNQLPFPLMSGAPLRTYNVLRRWVKDHELYLAAFCSTEEQQKGIAHLLEFCREVVTVKHKSLKDSLHLMTGLKSMLRGEAPELRLAFSDELARKIRMLADRVDFDIVQIEHGSMGMYLDALPERLRHRSVWILHDIDFDKYKRLASIEKAPTRKMRAWVHATAMRRWQPDFAARFGLCVTMSEADRQLLLSANPRLTVAVSYNGVDTNLYRPLPDEGNNAEMVFVGNMAYQPNSDGAVYFCREVMPLIRAGIAGAKLWIVGIDPGASVKQLAGGDVTVTGAVPDVVPYYRRSNVCVVPLRAGSGTRLKILEAMALGRAVVSTSIGCEGLDVVDGEHILIANDSESFAKQVIRLLTDSELSARIVAKAREFVVASYGWEVIARNLMSDFESIAKPEQDTEHLRYLQSAAACR